MTYEERFEKITERIDAIAMHLEITARMVEDNQKRAEEREAKWNGRMDRLLTITETLAATSASHERRIERLEGQ
jgi:hypothetical protein